MQPIEPPPLYTIAFRNGSIIKYRIDNSTIAQIAQDWKSGAFAGAYDVETPDGSYRKLALRFEDLTYIG